ncbi:hypothetical protein KIN34_14395 [Cellulomonas sp. DKR-3]|uniref:DUF4352 domain-containing protein n=1 Tax=Cellulomonas fulva TaxID=2835530 RepID=A0ABS5U254_9CELL|nr:hypothetical protein [Cellulomonas fulva]MBT0995473.1 hypothetical protein [Cellulomonas fulva]
MQWLNRHRRLVFGLCVLAAAIAGWALGTWSTCGPTCAFNVTLFEAWGTWFGAIATAGALIYTARAVRAELARRNAERHDAAAELLAIAMTCTLRLAPKGLSNGSYTHCAVRFTNRTGHAVRNVVVRLGDDVLDGAALIAPGAQAWGFKRPLTDLGLGPALPERSAASTIRDQLQPRLVFEFSLRGSRYVRRGQNTQLASDAMQSSHAAGRTRSASHQPPASGSERSRRTQQIGGR